MSCFQTVFCKKEKLQQKEKDILNNSKLILLLFSGTENCGWQERIKKYKSINK
jgi:hypothetical protein